MKTKSDVVIAGGGLAACIIALRLSENGLKVAIVEAGEQICGNHTWSFHRTDLAPQDYERLRPVVVHEWAGQKVLFPRFSRSLTTPYASITSDALRKAVHAAGNIETIENTKVEELRANGVLLDSEAEVEAPCVIDARGFATDDALRLGFQKFVGVEVELGRPHGEEVPTIMDASVDQKDGYRFFYVLPLSPTRVLIEDTRYSDEGTLDFEAVHADVLAYAANRGWVVKELIRTERGILPITLAHDARTYWERIPQHVAPVGLRAALFHPTTGYSLPMAVETANLIAGLGQAVTTAAVRKAVQDFALRRSREQAYFRFLNRMLFQAAQPRKRYVVMQRFYGLRQSLIQRFYAGRINRADKLRIITGKPPVPIQRALRCVSETRALAGN
ncbi:lycopene beta-cyclase CrtY [Hoeflea poritis]|uniref:Lycopene beta-cyclase CrtY n=1 Tax=Hoeflea poritis TaxID=2993659 RepID=A0ABT4VPR9_9HYPH|nr:lycopene beta-cyclase CrtY [Hoeflea poritis]MDA4846691.1 lycopene beta-cyclase CrtY [Hoeflea poritis]